MPKNEALVQFVSPFRGKRWRVTAHVEIWEASDYGIEIDC